MPANHRERDSDTRTHAAHVGLPGGALDRTVDQSSTDHERARIQSYQSGPPSQVEGYDIEKCLGAGAFGTVWLATQRSTGKKVAIKFYEHRGGLDWALLNREVEKLAFLYTDRDIVQLIDVGWDATPPYYVMEYLSRGSLEQLLQHGPLPASEAVRMVREVAQALVHAHGRGILHCDLKPANVLLDNDWKVRLADFGQSRLSYEQLPALGTLFYMAPEQADLTATPDARWDVYALGALLYHLLTGSPPHRTAPLEDRLRGAPDLNVRLQDYRQAIATAPPLTAQRQVRGVDRALAEIVNRSLEPDPARRYPNAQAVLDALDRRSAQRARRPMIALGLVAPLLLLIGTIGQGVIGWRAAVQQSESTLVDAVQAGNVFAAQGVANSVLLRLNKLSRVVQTASENSELVEMLRRSDSTGLHNFIESVRVQSNQPNNGIIAQGETSPFESWAIMDGTGTMLARAPAAPELLGQHFEYRDYYKGLFRGLTRPDRDFTHVSRLFKSKADERYRFGISALVRDGDEVVGIVLATIPTGSTLGSVRLQDAQRTAVLVGRWDTNLPDGSNDSDRNLVLIHPAYPERGANAVEVELPAGNADDNYRDPLIPGRCLAGFAPVGSTDFVVIVEQRFDDAIAPVQTLAGTLAWRGWTALCFGVILLGAMWYWVQKAMNRSEPDGFAKRAAACPS
jgi:serine/threonine protein kinase